MACARVCCILLGETRLLKWHVPVCAVFSYWKRDCSNGMCPCVLYSPRGDEIAQMACARVSCILLRKSRLLKWHVPVCAIFSQGRLLKWHVPLCAVFSQGRRDCSNGMCPCVLYSPRGEEIAQMVDACVCFILLGETRLLKWQVPMCAVFSQGRRDCSNGMCPCVLCSPRGDEIAQMASASVYCILLGETRLLKWHVPMCAVFSQERLLKSYVPLCAVFSQGRRYCSNGMCPCVLYSPRGDEIAQMACARSSNLISPRRIQHTRAHAI